MNDAEVVTIVSGLIDHIAELVVVLDHNGTIRYANQRAATMLGVDLADWIGHPAFELVHPDDLTLALELLVSAKATGVGVKEPVVYRLLTGTGAWLVVEMIASNIALPDGELVLVMSGREVSTRRPSSDIVNEAGQRLSHMFDDAAIGMAQTALDGRFLRVNHCFARMLDEDRMDLAGRHFSEFTHPDEVAAALIRFDALVAGTSGTYRTPTRYVGRAGTVVHVELTASIVRDRFGEPLYCAVQTVDITELRRVQTELMHRSTHDWLTGLATREVLLTLLNQALSRASRRDGCVAVLFLDLDGFKTINDTWGHASGDALLRQVAQRLGRTVRNGDLVCRFGGDEFVIMCENADDETVGQLARRLIDALTAPYDLGHARAVVSASIGIAVGPADVLDAETLVSRADAALYRAKRQGGGSVTTYQSQADRQLHQPR